MHSFNRRLNGGQWSADKLDQAWAIVELVVRASRLARRSREQDSNSLAFLREIETNTSFKMNAELGGNRRLLGIS